MDPAKIAHFNGLIQGVIGGRQHRHVFQPWELAILLDIESCTVRQSSREDLLRRYQRAAYLSTRRGRRTGTAQVLRVPPPGTPQAPYPKAAAATGLSSN
jgi:hypothetical protein